MPNPSTATTQAKGSRQAWTVACRDAGIDCPFSLTDHNQDNLVSWSTQHGKSAHGKTFTRSDVLGMAKPVKW